MNCYPGDYRPRHCVFLMALIIWLQGYAALPITEKNYLHEDSLIWANLDSISSRVWREAEANPEKEDSLTGVYRRTYQYAIEKNVSTALRYASVPSGIERVYMVRDNKKTARQNLQP